MFHAFVLVEVARLVGYGYTAAVAVAANDWAGPGYCLLLASQVAHTVVTVGLLRRAGGDGGAEAADPGRQQTRSD